MARLTLLLTLVVLALPSAALASSVGDRDRDLQALGNEYYYRHAQDAAPTPAATGRRAGSDRPQRTVLARRGRPRRGAVPGRRRRSAPTAPAVARPRRARA